MTDVTLHVILPRDREISGRLFIEVNGKRIQSYEALGLGSAGAGDTQLKNRGNTPTGTYRAPQLKDTAGWSKSSYGPYGALELQPLSGNAVVAKDKMGRTGILIHGGDLGGPNYRRGEAELRQTYGCIRLDNDDMKDLVETLQSLSYDSQSRSCKVEHITVIVDETSEGSVLPSVP